MDNKNLAATSVLSISMLLILASIGLQSASGHERRLYTIGDQDYLFVVGSMNEPAFVDDKSGVEVAAWLPDPADPMNSQANGTKPVEGLTLKVDVSAGAKNMTLDLEPAFRDPGHYETIFYPTVPTTYSYTVYGDINGTAFRDTFTCSPAGESEPAQDNSTVTVSDGITRIGQSGGFGCIESRADISFPEQFISNYELQQMINELKGSSNATSMP
ncbi:MAG: hypothetical protein ACRD5E_06585 [Nitrososphaeraceae archaeon]